MLQSVAEVEYLRKEWGQEVHQFDWVHVIRNVESIAMKQEGFDTPAHAALDMLLYLYRSAKDAAKKVTEMAGGKIRSASDINRVFGMPDVLKHARGIMAELVDALDRIIAGCGNAEVSAKLANAAPCLFFFIYYPGMPPHNNGAELIVRTWIAVPRKARGPFPNWKAAENFSILQTFAATCEKNGTSAHAAILALGNDPYWSIFTSGVPPPIFGGNK